MIRLRRAVATLLILAVTGGTFVGCSDFLDVNDNPNAATDVRMELILPGVLLSFTQNILGFPTERYGSTVGITSWGTEWMQQWSWNRDERPYSQFHHYEMSEGDADQPWNAAYANVMKNARIIMEKASESGDMAYHGIGKFIYAFALSFVTDAWGPVPVKHAFDTRVYGPEYDSQQEAYAEIHRLLEEAIEEMERGEGRVPDSNDLLYGGDMDAWVRLARSVQARLHLRLAYAPGESAADRAQKALDALAGAFQSNADDADFEFTGGSGARSSNYEFENEGWEERNVASHYFVELLRSMSDPRLPIMIRPALSDGAYRGHVNGSPGEPDSTISKIGSSFTADSSSINWMSYAETKFIEAEARLILAGAAAADVPYRAGIRAHMEKIGVDAAAIDAYLASLPSLATVANPLEAIITQKYIANFLKAEVWNDWRRTGYPVLQPVADAVIAGIPQRLRTPAGELSYNSTSVAATAIPTGLDGMLVKVWWASGTPPTQ